MESRVQQTAAEDRQAEEASAEGPCRLELPQHLRLFADSSSGSKRVAMLRAADEIDRLRVVIESYAASAKAAAEEIRVLRSHVYRDRIVVVDCVSTP